jgi:hypothetical protein
MRIYLLPAALDFITDEAGLFLPNLHQSRQRCPLQARIRRAFVLGVPDPEERLWTPLSSSAS